MDYGNLPTEKIGTTVEGRVVVKCDYCGRPAVKVEPESAFFHHVIGGMMLDGVTYTEWERCPKGAPIESKAPREVED